MHSSKPIVGSHTQNVPSIFKLILITESRISFKLKLMKINYNEKFNSSVTLAIF